MDSLDGNRRKYYREAKEYVEALDEAQINRIISGLAGDEMRLVMMAYLDGASAAEALIMVEVGRKMARIAGEAKPPRELIFGCG